MFQQLTPITKNIIILNVIVYILANFVFSVDFMYSNFSAFFPTSPLFKSWQIITHMFMHATFQGGGIMHIAFNMLTLASFGPVLERFLGDKKFLILYFAKTFLMVKRIPCCLNRYINLSIGFDGLSFQ